MASTSVKEQFLSLVQAKKALTPAVLKRVLELDDINDIGFALVQSGAATQEEVIKYTSEVFGMGITELTGKEIPSTVLNVIPQELAASYQMIAFEQKGNVLSVGVVDPSNLKAREAVEFIARKLGVKVKYFVISYDSWQQAVKQYEALKTEVQAALNIAQNEFEPTDGDETAESLDEVVRSAPISKMVSVILKHAVEQRASDVHIEPTPRGSRVRYRIDGILKTLLELPQYIHPAVVSRVKVLANLKIDETRRPQDGRIRLQFGERTIDFRVSTLPLYEREKVVLRVLETATKAITLEELGYWGRNLEVMKKNIQKPHGLFLVTGPTGSGKSTTLYSVLNMLNEDAVNITTLEDPVEYYLSGINQSQIRTEVGLTFAAGLRSILRQDPDVIMVGEIRDNETAELAIHASLTGHFVLSTLHTNDALGAIPRLIDMHAEPFLLASTLNVVIAQRLVRKICEHCRVEQAVPADVVQLVEDSIKKAPKKLLPPDLKMAQPLKFYHGEGCARCGSTGYRGRSAVSEVIDVTEDLRIAIAAGGEPHQLKEIAEKQESITIEQDGYIKALQGITSIEEVLRVGRE